jgi:hypothetical protein
VFLFLFIYLVCLFLLLLVVLNKKLFLPIFDHAKISSSVDPELLTTKRDQTTKPDFNVYDQVNDEVFNNYNKFTHDVFICIKFPFEKYQDRIRHKELVPAGRPLHCRRSYDSANYLRLAPDRGFAYHRADLFVTMCRESTIERQALVGSLLLTM